MTREQRAARRGELVRAAIDVLSEKGWSDTRVADVGQRVGISPGHVLYYFESKVDLFIEALRTIEQDLRDDVLGRTATLSSAKARWQYLLEQAAPTGPKDFRLMVWLQAWELAPRDPYVAECLQTLEDQWMDMLRGPLTYGRETGQLEVADLDDFTTRFSALMDGLWIQVVLGSPHIDRKRMLEICQRASEAELHWLHEPS